MRVTLRRLFAVAVLAVTPALAQAAAPIPGANNADKSPLAAVRKALNEVGDMNYQARSLNDIITDLKEKSKIPVILDNMVYQFGLDPSQPVVNVNLKQVKLKDGLTAALAPFNLKYGLTAEGLFISTEEAVITRQLRQRVSLDCEGTEFTAVIKQLANDTGANVVVDPRLKDKAKVAVTLKLDDVPLETAVRLVAEVSDLRAVRSSNVLFVTTADKAKDFRDDGPTNPANPNPFFPVPGGPGGGIFAPPAIGGFGGAAVPLPAVDLPAANPPAPPAKEEKKEEKAPPPAPDKAPPPATPPKQ